MCKIMPVNGKKNSVKLSSIGQESIKQVYKYFQTISLFFHITYIKIFFTIYNVCLKSFLEINAKTKSWFNFKIRERNSKLKNWRTSIWYKYFAQIGLQQQLRSCLSEQQKWKHFIKLIVINSVTVIKLFKKNAIVWL